MFELKLDDNLLSDYVAESREQLATVEADLLAIEAEGAEIDEARVNRVFRTLHSINGASSFFDFASIGELAHQAENVLGLIRSRAMVPSAESVRVLLRATDLLNDMFLAPESSNRRDDADLLSELKMLYEEHRTPVVAGGGKGVLKLDREGSLRVLLVEDDFTCRLLLQTFLGRYGECHIAVNGREAVEAAAAALERGEGYDLICMDIMMPEVDGREAVRRIRAMEDSKGIKSTYGAKIFMATTVTEMREVILCFEELCDAYLMKPIDLEQFLTDLKSHQLVS